MKCVKHAVSAREAQMSLPEAVRQETQKMRRVLAYAVQPGQQAKKDDRRWIVKRRTAAKL